MSEGAWEVLRLLSDPDVLLATGCAQCKIAKRGIGRVADALSVEDLVELGVRMLGPALNVATEAVRDKPLGGTVEM